MTRRRLLGGMAGVAAAAGGVAAGLWSLADEGAGVAVPGRRTASPVTSGRGSVVVVGGGLAGLTAAWTLREAGVEVTLVEAAPGLGGRVRTWRGDGWYAEAGGEFVDGRHADLRALLKEMGLGLEPVGGGTEDLEGVALLDGRHHPLDKVFHGPLGEALARVEGPLLEIGEGFADLADPAGHPRAAAVDARSAADLLDEVGLTGRARWLVEHELRGELSVEPGDASLLYWAQLATATAEDELEAHRIAGGGDRLVGRLAAALGDAVLLATPVSAVEVGPGGVRVRAGDRTLQADRVVLATPPVAAAAIRFEGRIPDALLDALRRLRLGDATKVLTVHAARWWRDGGYDGTTLTDTPLGDTWEIPGPGAGLIAFAGAAGAPQLAELGHDPAALSDAIGRLWLDVAVPDAIETRVVRWADERWVDGAYSAYAPGQVTSLWGVLRRPHGRVSVAGEHTARTAVGYMDGAVESGRRAAAEHLA